MSFWTGLYTLLLKPLELIFEVIYKAAYQNIHNPGLSIIALSLAMNFLVLPLYRRADAMQEEERETEARLSKWVKHIKATFSGDERTMMLQTYYRQNNYSPTHVLRGAVSLFLEIPFFIAAYRFLSHLSILKGVSFGPIADLASPDALLVIGGISVNILPIIMTAINIVSSAIFSKGYPLKTKIQLYGMAAVFLVLLYKSPAGLVFYWTLNNLFSLVKTIFYKLKNPKRILSFIVMLGGFAVLFWASRLFFNSARKKSIFVALIGLVMCAQFLLTDDRKRKWFGDGLFNRKPSKKAFLLGAIFLAAMTGVLIPSAVLKASPQEFIYTSYFVHPLWYIVSSTLLAVGTFVLWLGVFYWLSSEKAKPVFECSVWALCGIAAVNYLFFGKNHGILSANLVFDSEFIYSLKQICFNLLIVLAVIIVFTFIMKKWPDLVKKALAVTLAAVLCMGAVNCVGIRNSIAELDLDKLLTSEETPTFTLSKTEQNVVVIMLDRAMGAYVPYIFNERPELKEQFSGFTYYSNIVSFGGYTNFAAPALYGGYEYTPIELNKRSSEPLGEKHDEALKVMPVMFDSNGFDVTVFDPTYAGYGWTPDLSIYDDYDGISSYISQGFFTDDSIAKAGVESRNRQLFCYSVMKIAPLFAQKSLYDYGNYNCCDRAAAAQITDGESVSDGFRSTFLDAYYVLENLASVTNVTENGKGSFFMMSNDTTHEWSLLQEPDYTPDAHIDNTDYDSSHKERFTVNGRELPMDTVYHYMSYQSNMAAMIKLGNWFDYLKEAGVYDNTRIILVSDHGFSLAQFPELILDDSVYQQDNMQVRVDDAEFYYPLLMVKDFNSTEFTVSDEFMTNADVPTLAVSGVLENPINPMTGKPISNEDKFSHEQYVIASSEYDTSKNNGTTYFPAKWYTVHDSIWNKDNWTLVAENEVLP